MIRNTFAVAAIAFVLASSFGCQKKENDTATMRRAPRDPEAWKADNPMQIVLIGPPGAGKGTQARKIAGKYGIPHITTGGIFRQEMARRTEIGTQVEKIIGRGDLVPIEIVVQLVRERLRQSDCEKGFVLDGFPRTAPQLDSLDVMLAERAHKNVQVLMLDVPDDVLMKRLLSRGREDDTEETIRNRLVVYHERTEPLVEEFESRGILARIDGNKDIDEVFGKVDEVVVREWPSWRQ